MSQPPALPQPKPSMIPRVFGIINICWGALGTFGTLSGFLTMRVNQQNPMLEQMQTLMEDSQLWTIYQPVSMGLGFVLSVLLVVCGIGLVQRREWGRKLALFYGFTQFVLAPVGAAVVLVVMLPIVDQVQPGVERVSVIGGIIGGIIGALIGLTYAVLLVIFMTRERTRAACG